MNDLAPPKGADDHPWLRGPLTPQRALILAGSYRCGTTSMFNYLAGHPDINPSSIKEPAFFFSLRYREQPPAYPPGHEAAAYLSLFRHRRNAPVLLDGTSNYLHDPGCAARIRRGLPGAKVVILLREPIARLVSWYKFLLFQGWLPPAVSFEEWVRLQREDPRPVDERPYPLQALAHGRYSRYVAEYLEVFGEDALVIWFDDLKRDPAGTLRRVCRFAGLSPEYYDGYAFPASNEAMKLRRPRAFALYRALHTRFFRLFRRWPRLQFRLREILFSRESSFIGFFTGPADPVSVPAPLHRALEAYYREDLDPLEAATRQPVPWRRRYLEAAC